MSGQPPPNWSSYFLFAFFNLFSTHSPTQCGEGLRVFKTQGHESLNGNSLCMTDTGGDIGPEALVTWESAGRQLNSLRIFLLFFRSPRTTQSRCQEAAAMMWTHEDLNVCLYCTTSITWSHSRPSSLGIATSSPIKYRSQYEPHKVMWRSCGMGYMCQSSVWTLERRVSDESTNYWARTLP